ncbi:MAG: sensor histidine kinase [Betaproteobacteria bacterium]
MTEPPLRTVLIGTVFSLCYVIVDRLSYIHPLGDLNITPWNPPAAFQVFFLVVMGARWFGWVYLTLGLSDMLVRHSDPATPSVWLGNLLLVVCYTLIALSLRKGHQGVPMLGSRRSIVLSCLILSAGALCTAMAYVSLQTILGTLPAGEFIHAIYRFFVGDLLGMIVLLPIGFQLVDVAGRKRFVQMLKAPSFWPLLGLLLAGLAMLLVLPGELRLRYFFPLFFALGLMAAAHSLPGATLSSNMIQVPLMISSAQTGATPELLLELQIVVLTLHLTGLIIGTVVDERIRAQERLQDSLQLAAAGELAGSLAHELHQPLSALNAYAEAAVLQAEGVSPEAMPESVRNTLDRIAQETLRASSIVRSLRQFFTAGAASIQPVDPLHLMQECVDRVASLAAERKVELGIASSGWAPVVFVDRVQMGTALGNLLKNAVQASSPGQKVVIRLLGRGQREVQIRVSDEATPLSAAEAEQLFRPFATRSKDGLGLGLSISRSLVENNGGTLHYEASPEKSFVVTLIHEEHEPDIRNEGPRAARLCR